MRIGTPGSRTPLRSALSLGFLSAISLLPRAAEAFCGFYVGSADASLYNHATQVVLMREGTRTVLSMTNNYQGPPQDFAMVVPVPIVLQKENVKTLSHELFNRIDQLDAPRLVEYWEHDPCQEPYGYEFSDDPLASGGFGPNDATIRGNPAPPVEVLNRFSVGEYQIVILGAQDSLALGTWLRQNGYRIPSGAEAVLRPYVQSGMKFFVAKVDPAKVRFWKPNMATLSPLRFHYDTEAFSLPVRLGLLSSSGTQDLIIHILARGQRYEVANYDNVVIPTNLDVKDAAKSRFGAFYASLFDHTLKLHPRAVVTEYAWGATKCDPCPTSPLDDEDLAAFGGSLLPASDPTAGLNGTFVLTRLHARYDKDALGDDLVFRAAPPIIGGREVRDASGALEQGVSHGGINNFQARYAMRHAWAGEITCSKPRRGVWGSRSGAEPAQNVAFVEDRGSTNWESFLGDARPEGAPTSSRWALPPIIPPPPANGGCAGCRVGEGDAGAGDRSGISFLAMVAAATLVRRRSQNCRP
jgi:MYXO-CTERM domain-containing protein